MAGQPIVVQVRPYERRMPLVVRAPLALARAVLLIAWAVLMAAGVVLAATTTGRYRRVALPAWVLAAALAGQLVPDGEWLWLLATAALTWAWLRAGSGRPWRLSEREAQLWRWTTAAIGIWHITAADLPWQARTLLATAIVAAAAVPWWSWCAGRTHAAPEPEPVRRWREDVAEHPRAAQELRESRLVLDDEQPAPDVTTGRVLLAPGVRASMAAHLDEHVASLLDQPRGTITMGARPSLPARELAIVFSRPGSADVIRWWDGPTLDPATGAVLGGLTLAGDPVLDHLWHDTGGAFGVRISAPRRGKGVRARLDLIEGGLSEHVWQLVVDGKSGAGLPEIRDACDLYVGPGATDPERIRQWCLGLDVAYALYRSRANRYGTGGRSLWRPRPGEPLITVTIDEPLRVFGAVGRRRVAQLEDITGGGSSLGFRIVLLPQKGDAASLGTTTIRANLRGTGTDWIGPAGDAIARSIAVQDWDGMDPGLLPAPKGWAWWASKLFDQDPVMARTLYLPSRIEVEELGVDCPFGIAEEWAAAAVHPALHPDDQAAVDAVLAAHHAPAADTAAVDGDAGTATDRVLTIVPPPAGPARSSAGEDGRTRVLRVLEAEAADPDGGPLERGQIAHRVGLVARHVSDLLRDLEASGRVEKADGGWQLRKAAS